MVVKTKSGPKLAEFEYPNHFVFVTQLAMTLEIVQVYIYNLSWFTLCTLLYCTFYTIRKCFNYTRDLFCPQFPPVDHVISHFNLSRVPPEHGFILRQIICLLHSARSKGGVSEIWSYTTLLVESRAHGCCPLFFLCLNRSRIYKRTWTTPFPTLFRTYSPPE